MTLARKQQLSSVMKRAWEIIKNEITTKSVAMKRAWKEIKEMVKKSIENTLIVTPVAATEEVKADAKCYDIEDAFYNLEQWWSVEMRIYHATEETDEMLAISQQIANMGNSYIFFGNTYDRKDSIKATGAKWNAEFKLWIAPEGLTNDDIDIEDVSIISVRELLVIKLINAKHNEGSLYFNHQLEDNNYITRISMVMSSQKSIMPLTQAMIRAKVDFFARIDLIERLKSEEVDYLDGNDSAMNEIVTFLKENLEIEVPESELPNLARLIVRTVIGK